MINFDSDGANSIQLEIRLFRAKIQSPSNAKMASHLTFFFAAGLAFATPTHRTRVQRENFLSVFPRCAAKARGATSPERRIQIQRRGITSFCVSNGRERRKSRRSASRNARFSLRRRAPYLFSSLEASLLPWVDRWFALFLSRGGETRTNTPHARNFGMTTPFEGRV